MKKFIYITIFITLFSYLSMAQETTVWLHGSKNDAEIIKKKAQIEARGFKVFVNDDAERTKRHSAKLTPSGDEKFDRIFEEARSLMDKEEWKKATAKFNEIVCDCPENKRVDAALYWLAYCYQKQKMSKEASATIERLLKNFPDSSWADDARVMKYQIAPANNWAVAGTARSGQNIASAPSVYTVNQANNLLTEAVVAESHTFSQQTQLDREDEIRLAAFQSLFANDPKKAIEALGRLLQPESKASEALKREVLRTLRGSRFYGFRYPGSSANSEITPTILVTQINPILRDILVKSFQNQPNIKIRSEIIYSIANINDEPSVNYLAQLYPTESNKDLKKAIINSFVSGTYTFVGGQAFTPLESLNGLTLVGKAETEQTLTTTASAQSGTGSNQNPKTNPVRELRFNKLLEIFRSEKELELRRLALGNIQRFAGWSTRDGMIDSLAQMYDSETDEQFKISIIYSFSNLPKNTQATNKLLNIAKSDKSDKMRLEAIRALRNNNSPEVTRFLEDLIQ